MEDDRPTAGRAEEEAEAAEDALPDWRRFAAFAKSNRNEDPTHAVPFIPKRGEKDFQPIPASDFPLSSNEALLSQHQLNILAESRAALYAALGSGSRHHSSKAYNSFTWRPELDGGRASADGAATYGIHFASLGRHSAERKRLELLPEEALYLVERGAIELWSETKPLEGGEGVVRLPMSVQQAWSELIGHDELTLERFQVYAHLKRLGYVVVRARAPPPPSTKPSANPQAKSSPISPRNTLILPLFALRHLLATLRSSFRGVWLALLSPKARLGFTRTLKQGEGILSSLASGRRWASYEQIFGRLQIIPSGFDTPLPRGPVPRKPSVLTPLLASPTQDHLPNLQQHPYQTFFHVYKPVTKYRKSAPPPPDFQLVVINAVTTSMPDLFEFVAMFESTPFPAEDTLLPPPRAPPPSVSASPLSTPTPKEPPASSSKPPRRPRAPPPPPPSRLRRFLSYLPFGPTLPTRRPNKPSPYPRLKIGRRSIIVAVVDNGTSSFLRFSESEFAKLPWHGIGRAR